MNDGIAALLLVILGDYTTEEAFAIVEGRKTKGRKRRAWTREELDDITKLREEGVTWKEIADMFGVGKNGVCSLWHKHRERGTL